MKNILMLLCFIISKSFGNESPNYFFPPAKNYEIQVDNQTIECSPTFEKNLCKISDNDYLFFQLELGGNKYIHLRLNDEIKKEINVFNGETKLEEFKFDQKDSHQNQFKYLDYLSTISPDNLEYTGKPIELKKFLKNTQNIIKENLEDLKISINVNNEKISCIKDPNASIIDCSVMTCISKEGDTYFMNIDFNQKDKANISSFYKPKDSEVYKIIEKTKNIAIFDSDHHTDYQHYQNQYATERVYSSSELNDNNELVNFINTSLYNIYKMNINKCSSLLMKGLEDSNKHYTSLLANEEVMLLIGYLQTPSFISPNADPSLYCDYEGTKLDLSTKDSNITFINTFKSKFANENAISIEQLTEIFDQMKERKDLNWSVKEDGCFSRAEIIAQDLAKEGIYADKIWTSGRVNNGSLNNKIEWGYHVAPLVYVKDHAGLITPYVIDPATFEGPATMNEWLDKTNTNTNRKMQYSSVPTRAQGNTIGRNVYSISNRFLSNLGDQQSNENNQAVSYKNSIDYLKNLTQH